MRNRIGPRRSIHYTALAAFESPGGKVIDQSESAEERLSAVQAQDRVSRMRFFIGAMAGVVASVLFAELSKIQVVAWALAGSLIIYLLHEVAEAVIRGRPLSYWREAARKRWWLPVATTMTVAAALQLGAAPPVEDARKAGTGVPAVAPPRTSVQPPVVDARPSPLARATRIAARLPGSEWVLETESCPADSISFSVQGDELVAYPKGAAALHYRLVDGQGQELKTEYKDRTVIFQIHPDGFTHIDEGFERWYRRCA